MILNLQEFFIEKPLLEVNANLNDFSINNSLYEVNAHLQEIYWQDKSCISHKFIVYTAKIDQENYYFIAEFVLDTKNNVGIKRFYCTDSVRRIYPIPIYVESKRINKSLRNIAYWVREFPGRYNLAWNNFCDFVKYMELKID